MVQVVKDGINVTYPTVYPAKTRDKDSTALYRSFRKIVKYSRVSGRIVLWKRVYCAWNEALAVVLNFTKYIYNILTSLLSSYSSRREHTFAFQRNMRHYGVAFFIPNYSRIVQLSHARTSLKLGYIPLSLFIIYNYFFFRISGYNAKMCLWPM